MRNQCLYLTQMLDFNYQNDEGLLRFQGLRFDHATCNMEDLLYTG